MAKVTNAFDTYTSKNQREDFLDAIYITSPEAVPVMSRIGKGTASGILHEWQVDALAEADTEGELEGAAVSLKAVSPTGRVHNYCMIKTRSAVVTGSQEAVKKAGVTSDLAREMEKKMKELKLDIDTIISGAGPASAGSATTGRRSRGLEHWIETNANRASDGAAAVSETAEVTDGTQRDLTEALLKETLQTCYDNGANPKVVFAGSFNKGVISTFTGRATSQVQVPQNTVSNAVDFYIGDFHKLEIVPSRNMRPRSLLLIDPEYAKIAYLRPFATKTYDQQGDAVGKQILVEFTLEVGNEKAHALIADLKTS